MRLPFSRRQQEPSPLETLRLEAIAKLEAANSANLAADLALAEGQPVDCAEMRRFRVLAAEAREAAEAYARALA